MIAPSPPLAPSMEIPLGFFRIGNIDPNEIVPPPEMPKVMVAAEPDALAWLMA
jgi:hypothetical protein